MFKGAAMFNQKPPRLLDAIREFKKVWVNTVMPAMANVMVLIVARAIVGIRLGWQGNS